MPWFAAAYHWVFLSVCFIFKDCWHFAALNRSMSPYDDNGPTNWELIRPYWRLLGWIAYYSYLKTGCKSRQCSSKPNLQNHKYAGLFLIPPNRSSCFCEAKGYSRNLRISSQEALRVVACTAYHSGYSHPTLIIQVVIRPCVLLLPVLQRVVLVDTRPVIGGVSSKGDVQILEE